MAIKLDPEQLKNLAISIKEKGDAIADLVREMDIKIDAETGDWEGKARAAYFDRYEEILPTLQKDFPEVINTLSHNLRVTAQEIENRDQELADALSKK